MGGAGAGADDGKPKRQKDVVAMNSIWREHVKKERTILKLNENFRLNPLSLTVSRPCPVEESAEWVVF
jgi:hypothetical protein